MRFGVMNDRKGARKKALFLSALWTSAALPGLVSKIIALDMGAL